MDRFVYKLLTLNEWAELENNAVFGGSPIDLKDGYIHLSTADHVRETARLHFKDTGDLKLVEVKTELTPDKFKYEESRGGILFPHLYDNLHMDLVGRVWHLTRDSAGDYIFPDEVG